MPQATIIDLSHYNVVESLVPTAQAGIRAVIHKATEGMGSLDEKCAARRYLAGEADMMWGLYHFLRPGSMEDQAENFLDEAWAADVRFPGPPLESHAVPKG